MYTLLCSSLTQDGSTSLYLASLKGQSDVVNTLVGNGADVNQICTVGKTYGVYTNSVYSSLIPLTQNSGITPLIIASEYGHSDVVSILRRSGANISQQKNVRRG